MKAKSGYNFKTERFRRVSKTQTSFKTAIWNYRALETHFGLYDIYYSNLNTRYMTLIFPYFADKITKVKYFYLKI